MVTARDSSWGNGAVSSVSTIKTDTFFLMDPTSWPSSSRRKSHCNSEVISALCELVNWTISLSGCLIKVKKLSTTSTYSSAANRYIRYIMEIFSLPTRIPFFHISFGNIIIKGNKRKVEKLLAFINFQNGKGFQISAFWRDLKHLKGVGTS